MARLATAQQVNAEMGRHKRMSGRELALATGLPYRNLMRCLNAERSFTVDELARIAQALDVPITRLITESTDCKTADNLAVAAAA